MAINEKLAQLLALIYDKTKSGEIVWEKTSNPVAYQTSFAKYSVTLFGVGATPILRLYDEAGNMIEELSIRDTSVEQDEMLRGLYELARRRALGIDRVL